MSLLLLIGVLLAACSKNEAGTNGHTDKGEEAKNNTVGTGNVENERLRKDFDRFLAFSDNFCYLNFYIDI